MLCDNVVPLFNQVVTEDTTGTAYLLEGGEGEIVAFGKAHPTGGGSDSDCKVFLESSANGADWVSSTSFSVAGVGNKTDVSGIQQVMKYVRVRVDLSGTAYTNCNVGVWLGSPRYIGATAQ